MLRTLIIIALAVAVHAAADYSRLMDDLVIVDYINRCNCERLPVYYNNFLQGGYINMPSARMGYEGEVAFGWADVHPYQSWNLRVQVIDRLETTFNYRIFCGVEDPVLSSTGFGDFSDKGANLKIAILHPEDSDYQFPGFAIGVDDFIGTRAFRARYLAATQVFINYGMEATIGIGEWRINGVFGGISWMPFHRSCHWLLRGINLNMEYDGTDYSFPTEPHPDGREQRSPINYGVKCRIGNVLDLSASYIRGLEWAYSASLCYNFGTTKGFLPKIDDPLPYQAPVNCEPLGTRRSKCTLAQELSHAFCQQGFDLMQMQLYYDACCEKTLRIHIYNRNYSTQEAVRCRLDNLLVCLIPQDIDKVIVVMDSEGFPIQEYHYPMAWIRQTSCGYERRLLSPIRDVRTPCTWEATCLYKRKRKLCNFHLRPDAHTLFGSSTGKFKYAVGLSTGIDGYLYDTLYYTVRFGYLVVSDLDDVCDCDRLNPSQLINVRSDFTNYLKQRGLTVTEMYLQRNWNLGKGWFSRLSVGHFEREYGGAAAELLCYPVDSCWAFGIEGALLGKRHTTGIGFTDKIRKLVGFVPTYQHFIGTQYFLNGYFDWKQTQIEFKAKVGKFLANDYGARFDFCRYFDSGLRLSFWFTLTNGNDIINGSVYYDKGIAFSMPLDIFYTYSTRERWGYGMSAWLRDVGVTACTGRDLYNMINEQRQQ